jgi:2-dehydropantoate 2-reductase
MNGIPWWFARELPVPGDSGLMEAMDPGGVLHATLDRGGLFNAVVQSSNEVVAPATVLSTTPKRNRKLLGSVEGRTQRRGGDIVDALRCAGYEAIETPNIRWEIWNKMALWVAVSPMSALTGLALDRLASDSAGFAVMCGVMNDMAMLGSKLGFAPSGDVEGKIGFYRDKPTRPSLLKDVELGREPELASCLLIFGALARSLGLSLPYLESIVTISRLRFAPGMH